MQRLTLSEFIQKATAVHGSKYNYGAVDYKNTITEVTIFCNRCRKFFDQKPARHLTSGGCKSCTLADSWVKSRLTNAEFIERAVKIHGDRYDYSRVEYNGSNGSVSIVCNGCGGVFMQRANTHLCGKGCPVCGRSKRCRLKISTREFVIRAAARHGDLYDYSRAVYAGMSKTVSVYCRKCDLFFDVIAERHLRGQGCRSCLLKKWSGQRRLTTAEFIEQSKRRHGDSMFDYSKVVYTTSNCKVIVGCKECGCDFEVFPSRHYRRRGGCPNCSISYGERVVRDCLKDMGVSFVRTKSFDNCSLNHKLRFDFYLTDLNACIEFDGEQHYTFATNWRDTEEKFFLRRLRDAIKDMYCLEFGIPLLRIPYLDIGKVRSLVAGFVESLPNKSVA